MSKPEMVPIYKPGLVAMLVFINKAEALINALGLQIAEHGADDWLPELSDALQGAMDSMSVLHKLPKPQGGDPA